MKITLMDRVQILGSGETRDIRWGKIILQELSQGKPQLELKMIFLNPFSNFSLTSKWYKGIIYCLL